MHRIKIVTDSTCDLPGYLLKEYDITVMPLTVRLGGESYRDGVDITSEEFFERLCKSKDMPSTSQVSVGEFTKTFESLGGDKKPVLVLLLSARLSGTYQSAVIAKNVLGFDNIHIVDTKMATLAHGMVVFEAAKMAKEDRSLEEILKRVRYMADNTYSLIVLGTLTYLEKGGRINAGTAFVGNLLNIMPVVTFTGGEVVFLDKVRGRKKLLNWLVDYVEGLEVNLTDKMVGINYVGDGEIAEELKEAFKDRFNVKGFIEGTVGSVIGTYSGPDMGLGVYFTK